MEEVFASIGEFFTTIGEMIQKVFEFFSSFLNGLTTAINMILESVPLTTFLAGFLPTVIGSVVIVSVSVAIVKFTLGR